MSTAAFFDDARGAELYVRECIAGPSHETAPEDFDVPAIARELRDQAGSWCATPRLGHEVFWQAVQAHALPSCPSWCRLTGTPGHWTSLEVAGTGRVLPREAVHEADFGPSVTVAVGESVSADGARKLSDPVISVKHGRVEVAGETILSFEEALALAYQLARAAWTDPLISEDAADA